MSLVTAIEPARSPRDAPPPRSLRSGQAVTLRAWVRLEAAAASARGRLHDVNEDSHSALDGTAPLFVVADGVGGGALAAEASRRLVRHLHDALEGAQFDAPAIREALLDGDREVAKTIARRTGASGAATVALAAGRGPLLSRWLIAWVGDCRVYRLRERASEPAELLTVDDTYRHLREAPPPGASHDDPARMVGNGAVAEPNVGQVRLAGGEMLVICTDGVHKHVDPLDLGRVLRGSAPLARRCGRLLALARARGSSDDATVLVVRREPRLARLVALVAAGALLAALLAASMGAL